MNRMDLPLDGLNGLITTAQAAALFHVSQNAIQQRAWRYKLPCYRIGGRILLRLADVQASYRRNVHGVLDSVNGKGGE